MAQLNGIRQQDAVGDCSVGDYVTLLTYTHPPVYGGNGPIILLPGTFKCQFSKFYKYKLFGERVRE